MLYQSLGEVRRNIQAMEKKNQVKVRKVLWLMLYITFITYIKFNIFLNCSCPPRIKTRKRNQKTPKKSKKSPRMLKSSDSSNRTKTISNNSKRAPTIQTHLQRSTPNNGEKTGTTKISTKISQNNWKSSSIFDGITYAYCINNIRSFLRSCIFLTQHRTTVRKTALLLLLLWLKLRFCII